MKKIIRYLIFIPFFLGCNWDKPMKGKYEMLVNGDNGYKNVYEITIMQSTPTHITFSGDCPLYSTDAVLKKKGKKLSGNWTYGCGGEGARYEDIYKLEGKIISGYHHNVISGTYSAVHNYYGSSGVSSSTSQGSFLIRPK